MDETTINSDTNSNYTWLIRCTSGSVKNICINDWGNLITTISSTGSSYSAITKWTTDSRVIMEYLKNLFQMVQNREHIPPNKTQLVLDNTPYHRTGFVMNFFKSSGIEYMFFLLYTPELAPVEKFFAQLKSKIIGSRDDNVMIHKEEGTRKIKSGLVGITPERVRKIWGSFYAEIGLSNCGDPPLRIHIDYN